MPKYTYVVEDDGKYTIREVPIFREHDDRGFKCDYGWMARAVNNHTEAKAKYGYLPSVIVGHNKPGRPEPESVGFFDNLHLKEGVLYADLVKIRKDYAERILDNAFPNRSCEVLPKSERIVALALLGGTTPHFLLPQMVYSDSEEAVWLESYNFTEENTMDSKDREALVADFSRLMDEKLNSYSRQLAREIPEIFELLAQQRSYEAQPQNNQMPGMQPAVAPLQTGATVQGTGIDPSRNVRGMDPQDPNANDFMEPATLEPPTVGTQMQQMQNAEQAEAYSERIKVLEYANAALLHKGRKQEYEAAFTELKREGRPIDVEYCTQFALSLSTPEQVQAYFAQQQSLPPMVPTTRDSRAATTYDNSRLSGEAVEVRRLYQANADEFKNLGVSEDDLFFGALMGGGTGLNS